MLEKGTRVIIGLSGGPDSVCLFDILDRMAEEWNLSLHPVHVNHGLRGEDALADQKYCEELAASRGYEIRVFSYDCYAYAKEQGMTTEEAGRKLRYDSFNQVYEELKELDATCGKPNEKYAVAVAQNAEDQVETVLHRLIRGTGIDGLSGIKYVRDDGRGYRIIRPILDLRRSEILDYLKERNLEVRWDKTNDEPLYTRNKIRLELLPYLEEFNPRVREALLRLAKSAGEDSAFLDDIAGKEYEGIKKDSSEKGIYLDGHKLRSLDPVIGRRVLSLALKEVGLEMDMTMAAYREANKVIQSGLTTAGASLPGNYRIEDVYGDIRVGKDIGSQKKASAQIRVNTIDWDYPEEDRSEDRDGTTIITAFFDEELFRRDIGEPSNIHLRSRRPGDTIKLSGGTKKIQDLLVDRKIPKDRRDEMVMAAVGNRVIMVVDPEKGQVVAKTCLAPTNNSMEKALFLELTVTM